MASCPTCKKGFDIYLSDTDKYWGKSCDTNKLLQHINDVTLEEYHHNDIPYLFYVIVTSSIENLQRWVELFGVPRENQCSSDYCRWNISRENFIYLLDNGFDPNVFFLGGKNLERLHVKRMPSHEMLARMIEHGYVISSEYRVSAALLSTETIDEFDKLLDILNFTAEDGKELINEHMGELNYEHDYLDEISHISKKYHLGDYVKSQPFIKFVFEFIESLD